MKNLKIGRKFAVTFAAIIAIFFIAIIAAVVGLRIAEINYTSFYTNEHKAIVKADEIRVQLQGAIKVISFAVNEKDQEKTAGYMERAEACMTNIKENLAWFDEEYEGDKTRIDEFRKTMATTLDMRKQINALVMENTDASNEEAKEILYNEYSPKIDEAQNILKEISAQVTSEADKDYKRAISVQAAALFFVIGISALAVIVAVIMALKLTGAMTSPIHEIEAVAGKMAQGLLSADIEYKSHDELGSLADSMSSLCAKTKEIIADIANTLVSLANGDFQVKSKCQQNYIGDYEPILSGMRLIRDNLNATMRGINQSADQVAMGSVQMAENAQSLAEGATEQAGAVEELTAMVENVSSISEDSACASEEAYQKVHAAEENAGKSQKDLQQLIGAMERIDETSKEIQNIIASIEDIASQTNLLSLNASIEAARAGEAGKGFAIVATQIGKLASDSAQSAVDTRTLIEKSLEEVDNGNEITAKTVEAIKNILASMQEFEKVSRETSETSRNQSEMLKEVEKGIEQISSVVQSNSASAQETSAASEELSAQSETLRDLVSRFKLI